MIRYIPIFLMRNRNKGSNNSRRGIKNSKTREQRYGSNKKRKVGNGHKVKKICPYCPYPLGAKLANKANMLQDLKYQIQTPNELEDQISILNGDNHDQTPDSYYEDEDDEDSLEYEIL